MWLIVFFAVSNFDAIGKKLAVAVCVAGFDEAVDVAFEAGAEQGEFAGEFEVVDNFFVEDFARDE